MSKSVNPANPCSELLTGNEAVALGALRAGVKVVTGYPGTPSTGALASLLRMDLDDGRHVEWSINEKVAFEIAAGAAWAGQRALCTMKMSGLNVAYDSLISIAYSGCIGGLVIYVADDPGVSAGMAEQDSRGFARMSDLPMLEPASVAEAYRLVQVAFELSERAGTPVFVRLVTGIAQSKAAVELVQPNPPAPFPMREGGGSPPRFGEGSGEGSGPPSLAEPVAHAMLGEDVLGIAGVVLQFGAQAADVDLEVVDLVGVLAPPHAGQQRLVGQHLTSVAHQVVEQAVLSGGQRHRLAAPRHLPPGKVHAQVAADGRAPREPGAKSAYDAAPPAPAPATPGG